MDAPHHKTTAVAQMHIYGDMIDALLGGTQTMRMYGKAYLPQWANETREAYLDRLATSTLLPVLKETIGQMVGRVFFQDWDTSQVSGSLRCRPILIFCRLLRDKSISNYPRHNTQWQP